MQIEQSNTKSGCTSNFALMAKIINHADNIYSMLLSRTGGQEIQFNISSMADNGYYQESGTGPPSPEVVHEFLKAFMLFAIFTESGRLFHGSATLTGQKFLLTSPFHFRMSTFQ